MVRLPGGLLAMIVLASAGCGGGNRSGPSRLAENPAASPATQPAAITSDQTPFSATTIAKAPIDPDSGRMIAYWLFAEPGKVKGVSQYTETPVLVPLGRCAAEYTYYAAMLIYREARTNKKGEKFPRQERYYLFDGKAQKVYSTDKFESFLELIDKLPAQIDIGQLDTCAYTLARDMPEDQWKRLERALAKNHRKLHPFLPEKYGICTCEKSGMRFLDGFKMEL